MTQLAPGLRRILAPNPSPMTHWGTNTFVLGEGDVALIDPGPAHPEHLQAILEGLAPGERITQILVTHAHLDHSALARHLAEATGAPVLAFGAAQDGRSALMQELVEAGLTSGGEGIDAAFRPDLHLSDGDRIPLRDLEIEVIWTPGHLSNHICFATQGIVFTGDHVMGWASTLVSPPDGDLTAFMASCTKLAARDDRIYYPAHGAPILDPAARIAWLIDHRLGREAQILTTLAQTGPTDVATLTRRIYHDTPAALMPAAERNVFAHLIDLTQRALVQPKTQIRIDSEFLRIG